MKRLIGPSLLLALAAASAPAFGQEVWVSDGSHVRVEVSPRVRQVVHRLKSPRARTAPRTVAASAPAKELRSIQSDPMATKQRAEKDLQRQLLRKVTEWLAADGIPPEWNPPAKLVTRMWSAKPEFESDVVFLDAAMTKSEPVFRALGRADFSAESKARLVRAYHHEIAGQRLWTLGGLLAFAIAGLSLVAGYIRADEATKGYYTNRLRLIAALAAGGVGFAAYRWFV